jgi:hypothetical protein
MPTLGDIENSRFGGKKHDEIETWRISDWTIVVGNLWIHTHFLSEGVLVRRGNGYFIGGKAPERRYFLRRMPQGSPAQFKGSHDRMHPMSRRIQKARGNNEAIASESTLLSSGRSGVREVPPYPQAISRLLRTVP